MAPGRGAVRLLGVLPVPASIIAVAPGQSWTWRVGVVVMDHRVTPDGAGGCEVAIDLVAPGPADALIGAGYGPVVQVLLANLARVATDR